VGLHGRCGGPRSVPSPLRRPTRVHAGALAGPGPLVRCRTAWAGVVDRGSPRGYSACAPEMTRTRILYVEDNAANLALVRKVLEHGGRHEVIGVATGEEGLQSARREPPALALVDLDLPGIDGFEFARQMQADPQLAAIPLVAISASVMKHEREAAIAAGCARFIEKPFDIAELRAVVEQMLQRAP
jgi:two-component system cell cycle response regulator DivK